MLKKAGRKTKENIFLARIFPFLKRNGRRKYSRLEGDHDAVDSNSSLSLKKLIRRGENGNQDTIIKVTNTAYLTNDRIKANDSFVVNTGAKLRKHFDESVQPQNEENFHLREKRHKTAILCSDAAQVSEVGNFDNFAREKGIRQMAPVSYISGRTNTSRGSAGTTFQKKNRTTCSREEKSQFVKRTKNKLMKKLARNNYREPLESKHHKFKTSIENVDYVTSAKGKRHSFHIKQAKGRMRKACKSVWKFTKSGLAYHTRTPGLDTTLNRGLWT